MSPATGSSGPRLWAGGYMLCRILLGLIFVYASHDKILHPAAFAQAIENYQILPSFFINPAAAVLPWLELIVGVLLLAGRWVPGASLLSTVLMGIFLAALAYNQVRGLDVSCGCFSTQSDAGAADWWTVVRDCTLLLVSSFVLAFSLGFCFPERRPSDEAPGVSPK